MSPMKPKSAMSNIKVGIVGASGYTGLELIKILLAHDIFELTYLGVTKGGGCITDLHPCLEGITTLEVNEVDISQIKQSCQLIFLATPHKTSMEYVKALSGSGIKIVDLSADYRLDLATYERHYTHHIDADGLKSAVYGLPEFYKDEIKKATLIANPGCYPTATLLGVLPFCEHLDPQYPIFIDAKSGVSGAGKTPNDTKHFVNIHDNMTIYNPLTHRHEPEISEKLQAFMSPQKSLIDIHFVPSLIPITRGMQVNIYAHLKASISANDTLEKRYANEPFVRIRPTPSPLKNVCGTHFCDIYAKTKNGILFVSINIDNLLRGASSQAVVNANLMCGIDEAMGIPQIPYMP